MINLLINYLQRNWQDVLYHTIFHLVGLTIIPIIISTIVGVTVAFAIVRTKRIKKIVSSLAGIIQLMPSIVMLTVMVLIGLGVGYRPALVALILYSILPIIQNTTIALEMINPEYYKLAYTYKMTKFETINQLEIPLVLPYILTSIKLAMINIAGCSAIASMIGSDGLGQYIVTGLNQLHYHLVLIGVVPIVIFSLIFDFIITRLIDKYKY